MVTNNTLQAVRYAYIGILYSVMVEFLMKEGFTEVESSYISSKTIIGALRMMSCGRSEG